MSSSVSVSCVVVSYNTRDLLRRCLNALTDRRRETVVVDNASPDGSADLVRAEFPDVTLISMARNRGFGAAANAGIRASHGTYVLLLNADAWPVEGAVEVLVEHAQCRPRIALLGPRLVDLEGRAQRSVIRHPSGSLSLAITTAVPGPTSGAYSVWQRLTRGDRAEVVRDDEFLMGAALLLRRAALDQVGGFDESFFMFDEEVDLSVRLRRAGWTIEFCPAAVVVHAGGASTETVRDEMESERLRSHLRFIAKHGGDRDAERGRRLLVHALRLRRRRADAEWLATTPLDELLRPGR